MALAHGFTTNSFTPAFGFTAKYLNSSLFDQKLFTETKEIPSVHQHNEGFSNYVTAQNLNFRRQFFEESCQI